MGVMEPPAIQRMACQPSGPPNAPKHSGCPAVRSAAPSLAPAGLCDGITHTLAFGLAFLGYEARTGANPAKSLAAMAQVYVLMSLSNSALRPLRVAGAAALAPWMDKVGRCCCTAWQPVVGGMAQCCSSGARRCAAGAAQSSHLCLLCSSIEYGSKYNPPAHHLMLRS